MTGVVLQRRHVRELRKEDTTAKHGFGLEDYGLLPKLAEEGKLGPHDDCENDSKPRKTRTVPLGSGLVTLPYHPIDTLKSQSRDSLSTVIKESFDDEYHGGLSLRGSVKQSRSAFCSNELASPCPMNPKNVFVNSCYESSRSVRNSVHAQLSENRSGQLPAKDRPIYNLQPPIQLGDSQVITNLGENNTRKRSLSIAFSCLVTRDWSSRIHSPIPMAVESMNPGSTLSKVQDCKQMNSKSKFEHSNEQSFKKGRQKENKDASPQICLWTSKTLPLSPSRTRLNLGGRLITFATVHSNT